MEGFFAAFLSDPRLHVVGIVVLAMIFKCRVKKYFCADLIHEIENLKKENASIKAVQAKREDNYKKIPLMEQDIGYMKIWQGKSDERYDILDKKIDDVKILVTELTALVKQDLANKNKE